MACGRSLAPEITQEMILSHAANKLNDHDLVPWIPIILFFNQSEPAFSASDQPDILKFRHGMIRSFLTFCDTRTITLLQLHIPKGWMPFHPDARYLGTDTDGPQSSK
uniref:Uncharacterized protein n=1 Tax=Salix viminalis TaxID=40686 RepID=A0A6N2KU10_SALVM